MKTYGGTPISTTQDVPRSLGNDPFAELAYLKSTDYLLLDDPLFWNVQYSLTPFLFQRHVLNDPHFYFKSHVSNDPPFLFHFIYLFGLFVSFMCLFIVNGIMNWIYGSYQMISTSLTQGVTLVTFWMQYCT